MARLNKRRKRGAEPQQPSGCADAGPVARPLRVARILSGLILVLGVVMLFLGTGVATGRITEGWGFPMSAVPNWGRIWGVVLIVAAVAYIAGPVMMFVRPRGGSILMMIVSGLSVLVGTPLITTTTEIFYNLFQETLSRPDWVDSVWGYYMIVNVGICVAVYRAYPPPPQTAGAVETL